MMHKIVLFILISLLTSCYVPRAYQHPVPQKISVSHSEVMSRYKNKNELILDFGVPDKTIKIDSIEVLDYSLGEIERSSMVANSMSILNSNLGFTGILINQGNPFYNSNLVNGNTNSIRSFNNQVFTSFNSESIGQTYRKYAKFWMKNGQVIKWETFGIDKGYLIENPDWNQTDYLAKKEIFDKNEGGFF